MRDLTRPHYSPSTLARNDLNCPLFYIHSQDLRMLCQSTRSTSSNATISGDHMLFTNPCLNGRQVKDSFRNVHIIQYQELKHDPQLRTGLRIPEP